MWEPLKSAGTFSLQYFGSLKKAQHGALYPRSMVIGMRSTVASVDGAMQVFFKHSMNSFTMREISGILIDSTIMRAYASAAGAPQKKADKRHRHSDALEADLQRS